MELKTGKRLLDSVILIDHLNGIDAATNFISSLSLVDTSISVISRAEILVGISMENETLVKSFLDQFRIYHIDKMTADTAAELRRRHRWKLPDAFQAAIAVQHGIMFTTRNTRDFDPQKFEFIEIPYTL